MYGLSKIQKLQQQLDKADASLKNQEFRHFQKARQNELAEKQDALMKKLDTQILNAYKDTTHETLMNQLYKLTQIQFPGLPVNATPNDIINILNAWIGTFLPEERECLTKAELIESNTDRLAKLNEKGGIKTLEKLRMKKDRSEKEENSLKELDEFEETSSMISEFHLNSRPVLPRETIQKIRTLIQTYATQYGPTLESNEEEIVEYIEAHNQLFYGEEKFQNEQIIKEPYIQSKKQEIDPKMKADVQELLNKLEVTLDQSGHEQTLSTDNSDKKPSD